VSACALALSALTAFGSGEPNALAASKYPTPAIAVAAGNTVVATETSAHGLHFYWNEFGTDTWHVQQVVNNQAYSAPAMVVYGDAVVIAAEGQDNTLDLYWEQVGNSLGWRGRQIAGPGTTYSAPSMVVNGGNLNLAVTGPSLSLEFYWVNGLASAGHPEPVAGVNTTFSAPSIALNDGDVDIVSQGPANSLDFYQARVGTGKWQPEVVAGASTTYSAPSVSTYLNVDASVVAEGPDLSLHYYWKTNITQTWHPVTFSGPGAIGQPAIAIDGLSLAVVTHAQAGVLASYGSGDVNGVGWNREPVNTTASPAGSDAAATANRPSINIAVFGAGGELDFYWQDNTGYNREVIAPAGAN
jgi:hypothetical protein